MLGDNLSSGKSLGHTETNTFGVNAGAKAGVGGKVLGAEVGASVGGSWDHKWNKTTGDQESRTASDNLSESQSANVAHYHANGQDITLTDGGYWRDGSFHRVENFAEKRHAFERDFSQAQSLERQASRSDEVGSRLESMASISRSNGYQISDDMSQVIASRYAEMAGSADFHDLGPPSLTNTTPSPHQREVRNMIVGRILEQYAADGMAPVKAAMQDPTAAMGTVKRPADFSVPAARLNSASRGRHAGRHASTESAGAQSAQHNAPGEDAARAAIRLGATEVAKDDAAAKAGFARKAKTVDAGDATIRHDIKP